MKKIKIFIVEDDSDWLWRLQDCINEHGDFTVIGIASTKEKAIDQLLYIGVDVILIEIFLNMNKNEGIDFVLKMSRINATPIIVVTSLEDKEVIIEALTSGAVNYVNKLNYRDIPEAIRAAFFSRSSIHHSAAESVLLELNRMKHNERQGYLTPSEKSILKLLEMGSSQSQVAAAKHITKQTLKNHITNILKKIGVNSSKEAVETARMKGML